jgi:PAS domain S-box-containing protein
MADKKFAAYDHLPCAIMIVNDDGQYVYVNKCAEELLGGTEKNILGKTVSDFVAPIYEKPTNKMWEVFKSEGIQAGLFTISRPDGTDRLIRYSAVTNFMPGLHLSAALEITK